MSAAEQSGDQRIWEPMARLLQTVLPFPQPDQLRRQLAHTWREWTSAEVVWLAGIIDQTDCVVVGCAAGLEDECDWTASYETNTDWRALFRQWPSAADHSADGCLLELTVDERPVGALLLKGESLDQTVADQLADITARLMVLAGFGLASISTLEPLRRDKLEAMAEFAAGAGHEINNPLATITGRAQMLMKDESDPDRRQALATIGGQALRVRDMIGDAMLFGRPPVPEPESLDLSAVTHGVLERFVEDCAARNVSVEMKLKDSVPVWADRTQLAVVISSLIRNSVEAVEEGGKVTVQTRAQTDARWPQAVLVVRDDGPGLSSADREHLFDPFYSGRQAGRGLGFGLAKSWRIVEQHGGYIEVASAVGKETCFTVYWPAEPPAMTRETDPEQDT